MINDEEDLLKSVYNFVRTNLNSQITIVNNEKNDFAIDLITQDDLHYVYAGELLEIPNNIFVNFAIDGDAELKSNKDDMSSLVKIMVEVAFDNPKDKNTYFKSLRYMRALYRTLQEYEPSADEVDGFQLTKATPMVITAIKRQLVISGVSIEAAIG